MPVTTHPSLLSTSPYQPYHLSNRSAKPPSFSRELLASAVSHNISSTAGEVIQSSFDPYFKTHSSSDKTENAGKLDIFPSSNSFVKTAITAYNHHNHLIIRPDDVWLSILSQFNLYVNANAKSLRHLFVSHDGKKELEIQGGGGNKYNVDFGWFASQMGELLQKNVKDEGLREWIIPSFTTTEDNDRVVGAVMMMATLKKYFDYKFSLCCGLPAVTLLGEKGDYEEILRRLEKLPSFGKQTETWASLLTPIVKRFIATFDDPDSADVKNFWNRVAHHHGGGSGPTWLTGWITAFCFFSESGAALYNKHTANEKEIGRWYCGFDEDALLKLDGVVYHKIDTQDIPPGYCEVDVRLNDNGVESNCRMVAGHVGVKISDSGQKSSPVLKKFVESSDGYSTRPFELGEKRESYFEKLKNMRNNIFWRREEVEEEEDGEGVDGDGVRLKKGEKVIEKMVGMEHDGMGDVVQPVSGWFMFEVAGEEEVSQEEGYARMFNGPDEDLGQFNGQEGFDEDPDL